MFKISKANNLKKYPYVGSMVKTHLKLFASFLFLKFLSQLLPVVKDKLEKAAFMVKNPKSSYFNNKKICH